MERRTARLVAQRISGRTLHGAARGLLTARSDGRGALTISGGGGDPRGSSSSSHQRGERIVEVLILIVVVVLVGGVIGDLLGGAL